MEHSVEKTRNKVRKRGKKFMRRSDLGFWKAKIMNRTTFSGKNPWIMVLI